MTTASSSASSSVRVWGWPTDFRDSPDEAAFRSRLRAWIAEHNPGLPLHTSLLLAKEYAFTGERIGAARAKEIGLANHVCPDGEVLAAAIAAARKIAALPRQAVEATKRVLNLHVERAVLSTIDFAMAAETESFDTDDLRRNVNRFLKR